MVNFPVRISPVGGIDTDSDVKNISKGNYLDAKNIHHKTRNGNTSGDAQNLYGNEYVYSASEVTRQNKWVAIAVNATNAATPSITLKTSANGLDFLTGPITVPVNDVETAIDNIVAAIDTAITTLGGAQEIDRVVDNTDFGAVIIELGGLTASDQGLDWSVTVDAPLTFLYVAREAIPQGLTGNQHCIGSLDLFSNLFQFWTTQTQLPTNHDVINASNAIPIRVTELTAHGLAEGDVVNINGVQFNTGANGRWVVGSIIDANTYELIGSSGTGSMQVSISSGAQYLSTGQVILTTATSHGLSTGDRVYVTGSNASANGEWEALVITGTTVVLVGSTFTGAFGAGGTIVKIATSTHNPLGLGEIGVAIKNQDDTWTYTRLLRSTELNFRTQRQIDVRGEINNSVYQLYFVDGPNNNPRVFYYTGDFVTDGAIDFVNSDGRYTYGSISDQLSLILKQPNLTVTYEDQLQSGGALTAGNWRYSFSLLTESREATVYSKLSPPINVYAAPFSNPINILGNEADTLTSKANQIRVSGIDETFYPYIQVVAVNYVNGSVTSTLIGEYNVPIGGELVITHYGNEAGASDFDITLLNQIPADIASALNIEILDNRLVLSNTTSTPEYDLDTWAQDINYSLLRDTIQGVGSGYTSPVFGEYQDPENVFSFTSYMLNETYRFGIELQDRITGAWTRAYHVIDVTFDDSAVTGRRLATLSDFNLTNQPTPPANADDVYVYYIQFENLDWDYTLENGKTLREQYSDFKFVRSEVTTPTVLASGILFTGAASGVPNDYNFNFYSSSSLAAGVYTSPSTPYPAIATAPDRQIGIFYYADNLLGSQTIELQTGDELRVYGQPLFQQLVHTSLVSPSGPAFEPKLIELYGAYATSYVVHDMDTLEFVADNTTITVAGNTINTVFSPTPSLGPIANALNGYVFTINTTFITDTAALMANDYGVYQFQYYRPNANQYGDTASTKYVDIGASFEISTGATTATQYSVYGGDSFTQKSFFRIAGARANNEYGKIYGYYSQNRINSQMRSEPDIANQYLYPKGDGTNFSANDRIEDVVNFNNAEPFEYNLGYNLPNLIQSDVAYDATQPKSLTQNTRIWYSAFKPSGSIADYYRVFLPLSFYDENASYGPILGMWALRGELYTLQPRAFIRQFFNTRAELQGGEASQIILVGSGNVLSQRGHLISSIGGTHKWGQCKGKSLNGHDTLYWINSEVKKIMRFATDGTQNVSDIRYLRSFLANNLKWITNKDTPAAGSGVCMVWDARYSELYVAVKGKKTVSDYDNTATYELNDEVLYVPDLYERNFEQTGEIYKYINASPSSGNLPTNTTYWQKISHDNNLYYNEYTILYDEDRNTFECFISFKPNIFLQYQDKILSPRPVATTNRVYEHDKGYLCRWYVESGETLGSVTKIAGSATVTGTGTSFFDEFQVGYGILIGGNTYIVISVGSDTGLRIDDIYIDSNGDVQTGAVDDAVFSGAAYVPISQQLEHGYVQPILNVEPDSSKNFGAIMISADIIPYRVDFITNQHISYLEQEDFEFRIDYYFSTIKNDSTSNGLNNTDTSRLFGQWLKVKLTFRYLLLQVFSDAIIKPRKNQRDSRK